MALEDGVSTMTARSQPDALAQAAAAADAALAVVVDGVLAFPVADADARRLSYQ